MRTLLLLLFSACLLNAQTPPGAVGDWPFDGNANDMSGNANHGTVNGATPTFDRFGQPNKAYRFDGISSKIVVPHSNSINMANNQDFSFAFWMKAYPGNVSSTIMSKHISGTWNGYSFWANNQTDPGYCTSAHHLMFYTASGAQQDACSDNPVVNDTSWHFIVGIRDAALNKGYLYVDAVLQTDVAMSSGNMSNFANLGFGHNTSTNTGFFNGVLDGAKLYKRVLTPQEITQLFHECMDVVSVTPSANLGLCIGATATLMASSTGPITWYASNTSTNALATGSVYILPANSPGIHTYYAEAPNSCSISSVRLPISYTVNPLPVITVNSGSVCSGSAIILKPSGAANYTISGGFATVSPTATSLYTVIGKDAFGCTSAPVISTITVLALPTLSISGNSSVCAGTAITQTATGSALSYTWSNGFVASSIVLTPSMPGFITVTVTGKDQNNCKNTSSKVITVNSLPQLLVKATPSLICVGETATLTASGASMYNWNGFAQGPSYTVSPAFTQYFVVIGTGQNGCSTTAMVMQNVNLCTGLSDHSGGPALEMYPNPSTGSFTLKMENVMEGIQLRIVNQLGQEVYTSPLQHQEMPIDTGLPAGVYTANIYYKDKRITTKKLVVQQ